MMYVYIFGKISRTFIQQIPPFEIEFPRIVEPLNSGSDVTPKDGGADS
jgi:hypothetical protein